MRKIPFVIGQHYHTYNRGTDKRIVFNDKWDLDRFVQSIDEFNSQDPIGSIFQNRYHKDTLGPPRSKLVDIICYCLNPNHYHFILAPLVEGGIEKFMQKLGAGYTKYFNDKYKRSGVLFQGRYKSIHINTDDYLMYLSAYINLNDRVHKLNNKDTQNEKIELFWKSSWGEYMGEDKESFCNKSIVLDRYKNIGDYKKFAESVLQGVLRKRFQDDLTFDKSLLIEDI